MNNRYRSVLQFFFFTPVDWFCGCDCPIWCGFLYVCVWERKKMKARTRNSNLLIRYSNSFRKKGCSHFLTWINEVRPHIEPSNLMKCNLSLFLLNIGNICQFCNGDSAARSAAANKYLCMACLRDYYLVLFSVNTQRSSGNPTNTYDCISPKYFS